MSAPDVRPILHRVITDDVLEALRRTNETKRLAAIAWLGDRWLLARPVKRRTN